MKFLILMFFVCIFGCTRQIIDCECNDGIVRIIGEPEKRYQEDPIRILRAFRVCAKLNMSLDSSSRNPIKKIIPSLHEIPHSRLFDEVIKFFLTGHALNSFNVMRDESIYSQFFLSPDAESKENDLFILNGLKNTDLRINQNKSCNPSFLFSFLLWHQVHQLWGQYKIELKHSIAGLARLIRRSPPSRRLCADGPPTGCCWGEGCGGGIPAPNCQRIKGGRQRYRGIDSRCGRTASDQEPHSPIHEPDQIWPSGFA